MANITNIPAPRVQFIDDRTGLISREWYMFFLSLFALTGSGTNPTSLDDLQVGPTIKITDGDISNAIQQGQISALIARYDEAQAAINGAYMAPVSLPQNTINERSNAVMTWLSVQ